MSGRSRFSSKTRDSTSDGCWMDSFLVQDMASPWLRWLREAVLLLTAPAAVAPLDCLPLLLLAVGQRCLTWVGLLLTASPERRLSGEHSSVPLSPVSKVGDVVNSRLLFVTSGRQPGAAELPSIVLGISWTFRHWEFERGLLISSTGVFVRQPASLEVVLSPQAA